MIWIFIVCLFVVVLLLERYSGPYILEHLRCYVQFPQRMVEPDEPLTLETVVENNGRLPALFVEQQERLPVEAKIEEDPAWVEAHIQSFMMEPCLATTFWLLPGRKRTSELHLSFQARGRYLLGNVALNAGDFLGLKLHTRWESAKTEVVVMPRRAEEQNVKNVLGGFLGDLSVQRFILEDPVLTVGFREYTGREPMKAISWKQSARTGKMQVKQYDYTVEDTVTVLLNTEGGSPEQLERCYSLTRTVCETLERQGIPFEFRTNGDLAGPVGFLQLVPQGMGRQHLHTILYGLGRAGHRTMFPLETLVQQAKRRGTVHCSYLVITPPLNSNRKFLVEQLHGNGAFRILVGEEAAA